MLCPEPSLHETTRRRRRIPGLPIFLHLVQDGAIKAREKEKQGSPGVGQLEICPGQPAHSGSTSREVSMTPLGGLLHDTEK